MWAVMLYLNWSGSDGAAFEWSTALLLRTFLQAIAAFFLWYAALLVFVLAGAKHNGLIGDTEYSVEDDGFRYVTESTNSITRWGKHRKSKNLRRDDRGGAIWIYLLSATETSV